MTRVPTIHINLEPVVKSRDKLIEQFWECLNTRLDLGQDGNYVSTSSNTIESLTVKEGDILEEEPHFFLYLPAGRAKDDFEYSLKLFTEQVSKIDNHVFLIILIKSGPDISDMEFFYRGFGAMKKIYLKDSCILDEGDTKTTFNELADILKRKYNFKARNVRSLQKSCKDADGLKTLTDGRHEDQVKTYQACQRREEEDVSVGNILEEEPHLFLFPPASTPKDDFKLSLKLFTEQVSKNDSHVSSILLTKSCSDISHMDLFYHGLGAMKRIYLMDSCSLDQEDAKTFNEFADFLKRNYFQVRKEDDVPEDPVQDHRNRPGKPENSRILSITLKKRGIWRRFCNMFCCLKKQEVEDAKTLMKKDNYKFQRQFEKKFHIVPGALKSIVKALFTKYECEYVENRMLTCDELENLRRKLNKCGLQTDAFEKLMFEVHKFREKAKVNCEEQSDENVFQSASQNFQRGMCSSGSLESILPPASVRDDICPDGDPLLGGGRKEKNPTDSPRETSSLLRKESSC